MPAFAVSYCQEDKPEQIIGRVELEAPDADAALADSALLGVGLTKYLIVNLDTREAKVVTRLETTPGS